MFVEAKFFHKAGEGSGGGGGGSDPHNKGSFLTPEALRTAYPTAEPGDFAIVESTDTVWVWDSDGSDWKDGDTKGQVTSVNGQTGAVTVDALPSQTGNSGKFLITDGTNASWSDKPLVNNATGQRSIATGDYSQCNKDQCVVIGGYAKANNSSAAAGSVVIGWQAEDQKSGYSQPSVVIGAGSKVTAPTSKLSPASCAIGVGAESNAAVGIVLGGLMNKVTGEYAIQIGGVMQTNSETGTLCIGSYYNNAYVNYKLLDADGTIPKERLTNVVATPSTAPVLAVADWSSNTQTITVTGVTATNTVFVAPAPVSAADYASAGILCTAQAADSLTFTCTTVPSNAITLSVVILG